MILQNLQNKKQRNIRSSTSRCLLNLLKIEHRVAYSGCQEIILKRKVANGTKSQN